MAHHIEWIRYYALLFGAAYFAMGYPFDIFFVQKISQKPFSAAALLSLASHGLSTFTAFYALPLAAFALTKSDEVWFHVGLFGAGTGLVTSLSEYLFLRLLLKKPVSGRNLSFLFWNKFAVFWLSAAAVMMVAFTRQH